MSQTYLAIITMAAGALLPKLGVEIGNEALTTTVSVLAVVIGAVWGMARRYKRGDVGVFGGRK